MQVQEFNLNILKTNQCFYLLQNISNVNEIEILHNTPSGLVDFDYISLFSMPNGKIIAAWQNSLYLAPYYNLVARSGSITEIIPTSTVERVIELYDRQTTSNLGVFSFANSVVVLEPNIDWRCDSGKFGPSAFQQNMRLVENLSDIVIYEPIFSVNGSAHIVYLQTKTNGHLADENLNNAEKPLIGRSFWECLKVVREWSIVNAEPFNNSETIADKAGQFMAQLNFSEQELSHIDSQVPMQIAKYLMGDENARQRPLDLLEINTDIRNLLFRRLASGTVSLLETLNPGMWNIEELIETENSLVDERIVNFNKMVQERDFPQIAIEMQNKVFNNTKEILRQISNGEF